MSIRHFQEHKVDSIALAVKYNKEAQNVYELSMPLLAVSSLYTIDNAKKFKAADLQKTITPANYAPSGEYKGTSTFAAWALGYFQSYNAIHNKSAYEANKPLLQAAVQYQQQQFDKLNGKEKESFLSDVMWTYAMAIQAASIEKDSKSYNDYMKGLANLSGPEGTPDGDAVYSPFIKSVGDLQKNLSIAKKK